MRQIGPESYRHRMDRFLTTLTQPDRRRAIGWACTFAALVGATVALVAIAMTPAVGDDRFSYPQSSGGFVLSEVTLAVQHLPLIAALLALAAHVPRRVARRGLVVASVGMTLLAIAELVAISAAHAASDSDTATFVDTFYGLASMVIGLGLVVAGVSLARRQWQVPVWLRWLPLTLGAYVFVVVMPASGISDDALHWALVGWMLLFLLLGIALISPALDRTGTQSADELATDVRSNT